MAPGICTSPARVPVALEDSTPLPSIHSSQTSSQPSVYGRPEEHFLSSPIAALKNTAPLTADASPTIWHTKDNIKRLQEVRRILSVRKSILGNQPILGVLDPTLVTSDLHALQFECAALQQLTVESPIRNSRQPTTKQTDCSTLLTGLDSLGGSPLLQSPAASITPFLISSPYNFEDQLLDLRTLDTPNRLFALALTILQPTRQDYATMPYIDSLNWHVVLTLLRQLANAENFEWKEQSFYVVIFRSKLKESADRELLHLLDQKSHIEASASGGLLKYWFGSTNSDRKNLATCLWRSKEDARLGGLGPWHKQARSAARNLYDSITFSAHRFTVKDSIAGWSFEQWEPEGTQIAHPHLPSSAEPGCERSMLAPSDITTEANLVRPHNGHLHGLRADKYC